MASDALDKVFGLIDGYRDAMIEFQTGMTAIPALGPDNDGEGESKKAEYIEKYLADNVGFDVVEHYDAPDDRVPSGVRPNITAVIKGKSDKKKMYNSLCLIVYMQVLFSFKK